MTALFGPLQRRCVYNNEQCDGELYWIGTIPACGHTRPDGIVCHAHAQQMHDGRHILRCNVCQVSMVATEPVLL